MVLSLNHYACMVLRVLRWLATSTLACCRVGLDMLCWTCYSPSSSLLDSWTPVFEHVGMLAAGHAMLDSMDSWTPHGLMDSLWTPHPGGLAAICPFTLYQVMGIHATKGLSSI